MEQSELFDRVRELRGEGKSPKEIARALGVAPSVVAPIVREVAAAVERSTEVFGCWVNTGWSVGLTVDPGRGWHDSEPVQRPTTGAVSVLVARRHGYDKLSVCGYLADVYCVGIKNTAGPDVMSEVEFRRFREYFFSDYAGWQEIPDELARQLVLGSMEYANGLGFELDDEFTAALKHLGEWEVPSAITFGRDGKPFYQPGATDDPRKVLRILRRSGADFDHAVEGV
ncbi:helix-turn-helix domain-containing protein [Nonomuraea sp. NPDC050556]|uniref:helix-turn-helix domain-containing protein n=1 Tax=Nonomuraea sp. NPDC050556 TaxID=3364369 RepID=UPI0037B2991E